LGFHKWSKVARSVICRSECHQIRALKSVLAIYQTVSEGEFSEVRIAPPLYGRASYVQVREFVDPAYIRL
jgi:hypothetical protein